MDAKGEAQRVFNFIKDVIDKHGPRLPGSKQERAAQADIAEYMERETGKRPRVEPFILSPRASIGAIPYMGLACFVGLGVYYASPIASLAVFAATLLFAVIQVFLYKGWFDFLFVRQISNNTYSVIDGSDKIDYTIIFSGHTDSSWNWNMAVKHPISMIPRTAFGIGCAIYMLGASLWRIIIGAYTIAATPLWLAVTPAVCAIGFSFLVYYLSYNRKKASPGAMDNLTGVGLAIAMGRYYKENPDKLPSNCRIVTAALGAEEAGLKGSLAFVKEHKNDKDLLINPIVINLDSFRDYDNFDVVMGDIWQFSHFDEKLCAMATESYKEVGVVPHIIYNPVGGCDSTPFSKAGIRTITLAAQNPTATTYYHTFKDRYQDLDMNTLEKAVEALRLLTDKIIAEQNETLGK